MCILANYARLYISFSFLILALFVLGISSGGEVDRFERLVALAVPRGSDVNLLTILIVSVEEHKLLPLTALLLAAPVGRRMSFSSTLSCLLRKVALD